MDQVTVLGAKDLVGPPPYDFLLLFF